jgi:hypothetical protein
MAGKANGAGEAHQRKTANCMGRLSPFERCDTFTPMMTISAQKQISQIIGCK